MMTSLIKIRNKNYLAKLTKNKKDKEQSLCNLLLNPIDEELVSILKEIDDPYTVRKRLVQEQCAHFVFRHLVKNSFCFDENQKIKVMGLAGQNPVLAVASYMRRGLVTEADLFEKNTYIYENFSNYNLKEFLKNKDSLLNKLSSLLDENFWTKNYKKRINLINNNYLETDDKKKYQGFLLDHCGKMPEPDKLATYISERTIEGLFFIEATMIDGRGFVPKAWVGEFEDVLYSKNIFVCAKDSFEYKGGVSNSNHGVAMKTYVWVFEKSPIYNLEA